MKTALLLPSTCFLFIVFISACTGGRSASDQTTDTATRCFLRTEGTAQQDSTYLSLQFNGDSVSGTYQWIPSEKDARRGTVEGLRRGDTLHVVWRFSQEGTEDTLQTAFILQDHALLQQPFTVNEETSRQVLDNKAGFTLEYTEVPCF